MAYCFRDGGPSVGGYYMIHYLYTYKHGYVSRDLVGEIISLFLTKLMIKFSAEQ